MDIARSWAFASTCGAVNKTTIITYQAWFATSVITSMVEVISFESDEDSFASKETSFDPDQTSFEANQIRVKLWNLELPINGRRRDA